MNHAIEILRTAITESKVSFTQLSLSFDDPTDSTFAKTGQALAMMDDSLVFWRGDYLMAYRAHVVAREKRAGTSEKRAQSIAREAIAGIIMSQTDDAQRWLHALALCEFFHPQQRRKISSRHHIEAMAAANGDVDVAQGWLDLAIEKNMTVVELRQAMRRARATYQSDRQLKTGNGYSSLLACTTWLESQATAEFEQEQARAVLDDLEQLIAAAEKLKAKLNQRVTKL